MFSKVNIYHVYGYIVLKGYLTKIVSKKDFEAFKHYTHLSRWEIILVMVANIISIHFRVSEWELLPKELF